MNIRTKILTYLLPTLIAFVTISSCFFTYKWTNEIVTSFRAHLKSLVVSGAISLTAKDVAWLEQHQASRELYQSDPYRRTQSILNRIKERLPIVNVYIIRQTGQSERTVLMLNSGSNQLLKLVGPISGEDTVETQAFQRKKTLVTPIYRGVDKKPPLHDSLRAYF